MYRVACGKSEITQRWISIRLDLRRTVSGSRSDRQIRKSRCVIHRERMYPRGDRGICKTHWITVCTCIWLLRDFVVARSTEKPRVKCVKECSSELLVTATPSLRPRQGWTSYTHPHSGRVLSSGRVPRNGCPERRQEDRRKGRKGTPVHVNVRPGAWTTRRVRIISQMAIVIWVWFQ